MITFFGIIFLLLAVNLLLLGLSVNESTNVKK